MKNLAESEIAFLRAIELDPTNVSSYVTLSKVFVRQGQHEKAEKILLQGRNYFGSHVAHYQPVLDKSVNERFNDKAIYVYESYQKKSQIMQNRLQRLNSEFTPESP